MAIGVNDPGEDEDIRELNGEWNLRNYVINNQTWEAPPEAFCEPMTVMPIFDQGDPNVPVPNENAAEVVRSTSVATVAAVMFLGFAAFGAWNIARHDRYRIFTAASFILAGILLVGGVYNFGAAMPEAMAADAETDLDGTFSLEFEPYLAPEEGEPGFYDDFSGGYADNNPRNSEQLAFGPGSGWWLAGIGGVLAVVSGLVLVGAPQYTPRTKRTKTVEVVRYVPVPSATNLRLRRR
jgi:hypothetical protein